MPPEPKRPIEELLEASAKARRVEFDGDTSMPNPMRARLHEEITRQTRAEKPAPNRGGLAPFWPQISIATALAAVLVTAAVMWLGRGPNSQPAAMPLAMNASAERADTSDVLRSLEISKDALAKSENAPAQALSGAIGGDILRVEPQPRAEAKSSAPPEFAEAKVAPAAPALALDTKAPAEAKGAIESSDKIADAASVMTAPQMMQNRRTAKANLQQSFSQTTRGQNLRNNSNAKRAVSNILNSFQFEQDGRAVRVVDADGSTYTGKFLAVAAIATPPRLKQSAFASEAAKPASQAIQPNEQFFRATGYNSSLKKQVVFEGNYIPLPALEKQQADSEQKSNNGAQVPARIVGQAKIPGEPAVEVDAATVSP